MEKKDEMNIGSETKKSNKKRNIIIGVATVLVVGCIGAVAYMQMNKDALIVKQNIVYELGEEVSLKPSSFLDEKTEKNISSSTKLTSDLLTNEKKYTVDKKKQTVVSKDKGYLEVGKYEVTLSYKEESKNVEFEVKDTTAPKFKDFKEEIRVEKDAEDVNLKNYFTAEDLSEAEITIDEKDFDISKEGDYKIKVVAIDKYKNKTEKECTVKVVSAEEAKENGLTENKDGKMAVSKETQAEINSGKTTIKQSEDKIEKPSSDNNNSNTNNNSSNNSNNHSSKPSEHKHNYVEQFKTVHHEEKGHYENVMVSDKWYEYKPVYDNVEHVICNQCGADLSNVDIDDHFKGSNFSCSGYHSEWILEQVGTETIEHPAVYEQQWVVDQAAYDEKISTGFQCSCGKWQ